MPRSLTPPLAATLLALSLLALPAHAQETDPYAACAAMTDDAARLACFDATHTRQLVVLADEAQRQADEAAREEARVREEFGLAGSSGERDADEVTLTATVVGVAQDGSGHTIVTLDNGQVWRETNSPRRPVFLRSGTPVTLAAHWSGAFDMRFDGRSGRLRVARVR